MSPKPNGWSLNVPNSVGRSEVMAKVAHINKKIMGKASRALKQLPEYKMLYAEAVRLAREELPYMGPRTSDEYAEYLRAVYQLAAKNSELREFADKHMAALLTEFSAEYRAQKENNKWPR